MRKLTDGRPQNSVALSTYSVPQNNVALSALSMPQTASSKGLSEVERLKQRIYDLENELEKQKNAFTRKSSVKSVVTDPEL